MASPCWPMSLSRMNRGDKIVLLSRNNLARTTLLQILAGELEPDEGSFRWGTTTSQAYLPRENNAYFEGCTLNLVDWIRQVFLGPERELLPRVPRPHALFRRRGAQGSPRFIGR